MTTIKRRNPLVGEQITRLKDFIFKMKTEGVNYSEQARRAGITYVTINNINRPETDQKRPKKITPETAEKYFQAFPEARDYVFGEPEPESPPENVDRLKEMLEIKKEENRLLWMIYAENENLKEVTDPKEVKEIEGKLSQLWSAIRQLPLT